MTVDHSVIYTVEWIVPVEFHTNVNRYETDHRLDVVSVTKIFMKHSLQLWNF